MRRRGSSSVTLADVAERAGVSLATASRVINGSSQRTVGEPYRSKVLAAASELGYSPNALAQAVARGANNLVGLILQDITDPYFSSIADGVTRVAESRGMIVLLMSAHHDPQRELEYLAALRGQRVRAIVLTGSRDADRGQLDRTRREIERFTAMGGRVAAVTQDRLNAPTVAPRNRAGTRQHREPLMAGCFREGVREAGLGDDAVTVVDDAPFNWDGGHAAMRELLDRGLEPSCIFAVNDVMALGAMAGCREAGIAIPHDLSIAGFDDIATLRDVNPSLTTVRLPLREMGEMAAEMALDGLDGQSRVRHVDGEVLLRDSTAAGGSRTVEPASGPRQG